MSAEALLLANLMARTPAPNRTAPLLRSKVAQLVDHLRKAIERGALTDPLPPTRLWSRQLGVSRRTLNSAIRELQAEAWLKIHRRRLRLNPKRPGEHVRRVDGPRQVRLLLFGAYRRYNHNNLETISTLREHLLRRGIELQWEFCVPARLREITRQPRVPNELLLLASVPPAYQRLFAAGAKPALVYGELAPGVALPFVNVDQAGTVRHATFRLLQRGFREVVFVHIDVDAAGIRSSVAEFCAATAAWAQQPVRARVFPTALDPLSLAATVRRLASGVTKRTGIIVAAPVPIGLVVTGLWNHGIAVPKQVEIVALFHSDEAVKLSPPPIHYPLPVDKVVRQLTQAAVAFFETGRLPPIAKTILTEIAAT